MNRSISLAALAVMSVTTMTCRLAAAPDPAVAKPAEQPAAPVAPASTEPAKPQPAAPSTPVITLLEPGAEPRTVLRLHPAKGDTQVMKMKMIMSMQMSMGAQAMPAMKLPETLIYMKSMIDSIGENGDIQAGIEVTEAKAVETPGVEPTMLQMMDRSIRTMRGMTGTMTMSNRGEMRAVEMKLPAGAPAAAKQQMEAMKQSFSQMCMPLPAEAVGVGARWQVDSIILTGGMSIRQRATFTLRSIQKDRMEASIAMEQAADPQDVNAPGIPAGAAKLKSLSSSGSGTMSLNLTEMMPHASKVNVANDVIMTMTMGETAQDMQQHMEMDMEMSSSDAVDEPAAAPKP